MDININRPAVNLDAKLYHSEVMLWHDRVEDVLTRCDRRTESVLAVHVSEAACEFGVVASSGRFQTGSYHPSL